MRKDRVDYDLAGLQSRDDAVNRLDFISADKFYSEAS